MGILMISHHWCLGAWLVMLRPRWVWVNGSTLVFSWRLWGTHHPSDEGNPYDNGMTISLLPWCDHRSMIFDGLWQPKVWKELRWCSKGLEPSWEFGPPQLVNSPTTMSWSVSARKAMSSSRSNSLGSWHQLGDVCEFSMQIASVSHLASLHLSQIWPPWFESCWLDQTESTCGASAANWAWTCEGRSESWMETCNEPLNRHDIRF